MTIESDLHKSKTSLVIVLLLVALAITGGVMTAFYLMNRPSPAASSTVPPTSTGKSPSSGGATSSSKKNPSSNQIFEYTLWIDPREHAFFAYLPKGWTATGGVWRPYGGARFNFTASDQTGTMGVFFRMEAYPTFLEPSSQTCSNANYLYTQFGSALGPCTEGNYWPQVGYTLDGCSGPDCHWYVWPYLDAKGYVQQFYLPLLQRVFPDAQLASYTQLTNYAPDLSSQLYSQISGGDATFSYTYQGENYSLGLIVVTKETATGNWDVDFGGAYAPTVDFSMGRNVTRYYSKIIPTVELSLPWLRQEVQRGQITQAYLNQIAQANYQMIKSAVDTAQQINNGWMNTMSQTVDVLDPNGPDMYGVSVHNCPFDPNYPYHYLNVNGDCVNTQIEEPPDLPGTWHQASVVTCADTQDPSTCQPG